MSNLVYANLSFVMLHKVRFGNATPRTAAVGSCEPPPPIFKEVNYYDISVSLHLKFVSLVTRLQGYSRVISRKNPEGDNP